MDKLAKICHQANKAYCETLGDTSQPHWEDAPEWQKISARRGVKYRIDNPDATSADMHESWLKTMQENGWIYDETKNIEAKKHPCCVEYSELPEAQQRKDALFSAIVNALT